MSEPPEVRTGQGRQPGAGLTRFAWLSIAAALGTMGIKTVAWAITGSVGLLSDAAESSVNLVAAVVALIALRIAARPPDEGHNFGHAKAEYFSAWFEGLMIFAAAAAIIVTSVERFLHPRALDNVGEGLLVSGVAGVINAIVGVTLLRAGRRHRSLTLTADGKHLLTDVWTSVGVIVGVIAVAVTGFVRLDPIVALLVGVNIVVTGVRLLGQSAAGFMDHAIAPTARAELDRVLSGFSSRRGVSFHDIRTREAGRDQLVSLHVVVPGDWSVQRGHDLLGELEAVLGDAMENTYVQARLEPREAPCTLQPDEAGAQDHTPRRTRNDRSEGSD